MEDNLKLSRTYNKHEVDVERMKKRIFEEIDSAQIGTRRSKRRASFHGIAAACVATTLLFSTAVLVSPSFAAIAKEIPVMSAAVQWLDAIRGYEGVKNAQNYGYEPFKPITQQKDGVTIQISDMYLSSDKLMYKVLYSSDEITKHAYRLDDGGLSIDSKQVTEYSVSVSEFASGISIGGPINSNIVEDETTKKIFYVESVRFDLDSEKLKTFLKSKPTALHVDVDAYSKGTSHTKWMSFVIPFNPDKLAQDRLIPLSQNVATEPKDPDLVAFTLDKINITPTNTYLTIATEKNASYYVEFAQFGDEVPNNPYLKDDKGNIYPLMVEEIANQYGLDPGNTTDGSIMTFTNSPYFDPNVSKLYFHVNNVHIRDKSPSGSVTVSTKQKFPQSVSFKNKSFTIENAKYEKGLLILKLKNERPETGSLSTVHFDIPDYRQEVYKDKTKKYAELRKSYADYPGTIGIPELDAKGKTYTLAVRAPQADSYEIKLSRSNDQIEINRDILIQIK
ncbi:DUF4179 domain-containing protein [Cohnella terricola]|uniref:DUF4179 domain-containing protein n=1 Tax=Cohnella terricola TaxID=1289167 RepID=A0A559J9V7_9BACL|nr:DUF4179 domain-containing protein [Cohnella terricola]TVX96641.1 DUF4179 domain-containing protein [Cohnella terricola]